MVKKTGAVVTSVHEWAGERLSYCEVAPESGVAERGQIVVMHGGGPADNKEPSIALAQDLAALGYHVWAIDFTGSGQSSGNWSELSLDRRRDQARSLIEACIPQGSPLIFLGFSMSGQTAADLAESFGERVAAMVLCAPGIYGKQLRDIPFGDESFAELIFDAPEILPSSSALHVFATFPGRILLVVPSHDEMVPLHMSELIGQSIQANPRAVTLVLDGAGHQLNEWLADHSQDRREVIKGLLG